MAGKSKGARKGALTKKRGKTIKKGAKKKARK